MSENAIQASWDDEQPYPTTGSTFDTERGQVEMVKLRSFEYNDGITLLRAIVDTGNETEEWLLRHGNRISTSEPAQARVPSKLLPLPELSELPEE